MRIIHLLQKPQLRGAEIFACQLSDHLMEMGHEVIVVTIFKGDATLPFSGKTVDLERPLANRMFDMKGWRKFHSLVYNFRPDIIQANASDTLKFAVSSKTIFGWKVPVVFRNANKMGDFIRSRIKWRLNNFYVSKVHFVISVSKECERNFRETFNYPGDKIETIEIGVEEKKLGAIPEDLRAIFDRGPVLTHIGGFVPEKNHRALIRIFRKSLEEFPDLQLLLIGKGNLQPEIMEEVKQLEIGDHVHFLGYRTDVLEILHHSRAFLMPSLIEGLPAVILEAMYCETPVVAYNVGGVGEVVVSEETGWLIEKNNLDAFQESLREVMTDAPKVRIIVSKAKKMIQGKFMNRTIAERFLDTYQRMLEKA